MRSRLALVGLLGLLITGCGGTTTSSFPVQSSPAAPASQSPAETPGQPSDAPSTTSGATAGKDACAALPRAVIQEVAGKDPGEGELEHAATTTICRYYGDARVTVEIDEGSVIAEALVSIEAYGDSCEPIDDIGDEALFCTGGFKAEGFNGQVVWTDGLRTYYVVYNFGDAAPSKEFTLALARRLEP